MQNTEVVQGSEFSWNISWVNVSPLLKQNLWHIIYIL